MSTATYHARPRLHHRRGPPTDLRLVRRAHGALRLHRHLRARPPAADERGFRTRRPRPGEGDGPDRGPLPRRQLRLRVPLGGRRRPGRATAPRSTAPGTRSRPTRSACTSSWTGREEADVEVMEAVNLGTRGVEEARALVEYANHPGGTDCRTCVARTAHEDPFDIKLWCLGNEIDGPWQIGGKTADEYGRLAQSPPRPCGWSTRRIELVAVGSSGRSMPTFGAWEHTVLAHAYDEVDYISLHAYYQEHDGDARVVPRQRRRHGRLHRVGVVATVDAVRAARQAHEADRHLVRRVERLVPVAVNDTEDQPNVIEKAGVEGAPAAHRGRRTT